LFNFAAGLRSAQVNFASPLLGRYALKIYILAFIVVISTMYL